MAKTSAQRQEKYRKTRAMAGENGERRINTFVSTKAFLALERLSNRYCVTKRALLEKLIVEADDEITKSLDLDSQEWQKYFAIK